MTRLARAEVFAPDEVAVVHVIGRVVRRCFLLGDDPVTGKNFDHRKVWGEDQLRRLAGAFGIDLLAFSCLSNHFHLILRSRPDVVQTWDDTEVARRWLLLCPIRKRDDGASWCITLGDCFTTSPVGRSGSTRRAVAKPVCGRQANRRFHTSSQARSLFATGV